MQVPSLHQKSQNRSCIEADHANIPATYLNNMQLSATIDPLVLHIQYKPGYFLSIDQTFPYFSNRLCDKQV